MMRRSMGPLVLVTSLMLMITSCDPFSYTYTPAFHALIFSADYKGTSGELHNTIDDGDDMAAVFSAYGFTSVDGSTAVNRSTEVTKDAIIAAIGDVKEIATEDDITLFYFSGHGTYYKGSSYILTQIDTDGYEVLGPKELLDALKTVPGKKIVILDTCFSGGFVSDAGYDVDGLPENYTDKLKPSAFSQSWERFFSPEDLSVAYPNITVISAAGEDEESWENTGINNGYFTYYFLQVLGYDHSTKPISPNPAADRNKDGYITVSEAYGAAFELFSHEYLNRYNKSDEATRDYFCYYPHISGGHEDVILIHLDD